MAALKDALLAVKGKVVAKLPHDDLRQEPGTGDATLLQDGRQRRDHRHGIHLPARHILAPDQPPAKEPRRLIIKLLADFLSDQPPCLRRLSDLFRVDDLLDYRKILRPAFLAAKRPPLFRRMLRVSLLVEGPRRLAIFPASNPLRLGA